MTSQAFGLKPMLQVACSQVPSIRQFSIPSFNPKAWEVMFEEVKNDNFGLEWEPTHQMVQLIDPVTELRK